MRYLKLQLRGGYRMSEEHEREWYIFTQNREAVLEALQRGECDGILPAARGFLDGFAEWCLAAGVLQVFEGFTDRRARRSIPMFFFCNTLIHRPLFHLPGVAAIERTLFRSPYILRQLGFNAQQMEEGFYKCADRGVPFRAHALREGFARSRAEDYLENQQQMLRMLWAYCPGQLRGGVWAMDSVHVRIPRGSHSAAQEFKVCVLGLWQEEQVWPLLWMFVGADEAEITVGRKLIATAEAVLGEGTIRHLLVDRGYLDGEWLTTLRHHGTRVTIGVREDMLILEEMRNLSQLSGMSWRQVQPPKFHQEPKPRREVLSLPALEAEWATCQVPLSSCLVRDTYPDKVEYYGLVTTEPQIAAEDILSDYGQRWALEEAFMALTRYWHFDELPACRVDVAYALVHFTLLAYTLLAFYLQDSEADPQTSVPPALPPLPLPERELAVYAGPHFALLLPSQLIAIILEHSDAWQANRAQLLMALRITEGKT